MTLSPCVSKVKGACATKEEATAFYEANSKLQFMYVDKFFNINDYDFIFDKYINSINYVSIDPAYL